MIPLIVMFAYAEDFSGLWQWLFLAWGLSDLLVSGTAILVALKESEDRQNSTFTQLTRWFQPYESGKIPPTFYFRRLEAAMWLTLWAATPFTGTPLMLVGIIFNAVKIAPQALETASAIARHIKVFPRMAAIVWRENPNDGYNSSYYKDED